MPITNFHFCGIDITWAKEDKKPKTITPEKPKQATVEKYKHALMVDAGDVLEWDEAYDKDTKQKVITDIRLYSGKNTRHRVFTFDEKHGSQGKYYIFQVDDLRSSITRENAEDLYRRMKEVLGYS